MLAGARRKRLRAIQGNIEVARELEAIRDRMAPLAPAKSRIGFESE